VAQKTIFKKEYRIMASLPPGEYKMAIIRDNPGSTKAGTEKIKLQVIEGAHAGKQVTCSCKELEKFYG